MKSLLILLTLNIVLNQAFAIDKNIEDQILATANQQIIDAEKLIGEVGREKISDIYFQPLVESYVALAQLKAEPIDNKSQVEQKDSLFSSLHTILYPQKRLLKSITTPATGNGVIRGRITESLNGQAMTYGWVRLYGPTGTYLGQSQLDSLGRYNFTSLSSGQYFVVANLYNNYVDTAYPHIFCEGGLGSGCQISDLIPIVLGVDEVLQGVDIQTSQKPLISGVISDEVDSSLLLHYPTVRLYDSSGVEVGYSNGSYDGSYVVRAPSPGDYYLVVSHSDYKTELYNNVICSQSSCDFNLGTLIHFNENEQKQNFNVTLKKLATISGRVYDAITSNGLTQSNIRVYNSNNFVVSSTNNTITDIWEAALPAGNYTAVATHIAFLANKYSGNSCLSSNIDSCQNVSGTIVAHGASNTSGIDFPLETGGAVTGTVTNALGEPLSYISIQAYSTINNQFISETSTDNFGNYQTSILNNGSYYIVANLDYYSTYEKQLYSNVYCDYSGSNTSCDFNLGTPITINNLTGVNNVDFQLVAKSKISGQVVDSNNNPLAGITVIVQSVDVNDNYAKSAYTDSDGSYLIDRLPRGSYRIYAKGGEYYQSVSYNNYTCSTDNCNGANYTTLVLNNSDLTNRNFQLGNKPTVSFNFSSNSANPVNHGSISIFRADGSYLRNGDYDQVFGLPTGDYYFIYNHNNFYGSRFVPKVYGGGNCFSNCDATTGTLVHVSSNSQLTLNMTIDEKFAIHLTTPLGGNYSMQVYDADLSSSYGKNLYGDVIYYLPSIDAKYLKFAKTNYYSQVYSGIDCEDSQCDISQGQLVVPQLNFSININVDLTPLASVSGRIFDENNTPLSNKRVYISQSLNAGYSNSYIVTNSNGEYEFAPYAVGTHYLYVKSDDGYNYVDTHATTYYGDIACEESDCTSMGINPITLNIGSYLTGYDIHMVTRGTLSGTGIVNTFNETKDTQLSFYKVSNTGLNNIRSINLTSNTLPITYLPEGEYKLVITPQNSYVGAVYSAYPNVDCHSDAPLCAQNAMSLTVTNGNNTSFSSFVFHQQGIVQGTIVDAVTLQPIPSIEVKAYLDGQGLSVSSQSTSNSVGHYEQALSSEGDFYFYYDTNYGWNNNGINRHYISQLYNGMDCVHGIGVGCLLTQGQLISVMHDTKTTIDITLNPKPKLLVKFIDSVSKQSIHHGGIRVFDQSYNQVFYQDYSSSNLLESLYPGSYYVIAGHDNQSYHETRGFPNIYCSVVDQPSSCDSPLQLVTLSLGDPMKVITLESPLLKGVSGYVTDVDTGQPIANVIVDSWRDTGYIRNIPATTGSNGGFSIPTGENQLSYLSTDTNNAYINEVYKDIECQQPAILGNCDVTQGMLINVPQNNTIPIIVNIELSTNSDQVFVNSFE